MINMTIAIFDFDQTLYKCPLPTDENRELLKDALGFTAKGWWSKKESLDLGVFEIEPNPYVRDEYDRHNNIGNPCFLVTGRLFKIKDSVRKVFKKDGFEFDAEYYSDRHTLEFKIGVIQELVEAYEPKLIEFYDDRVEHTEAFLQVGRDLKNKGIELKYHLVNEDYTITELDYL